MPRAYYDRMRAGVNVLLVWSALAAIQALPSMVSAAEREAPQVESRWVPSLALTSGILFQRQSGTQSSFLFDGESADPTAPTPLRRPFEDEDLAVTPFVGAALELMTPALPLPASPRAFLSGEILPTFAPKRHLTEEGQAARIRGPEVGAVLAEEEDNTHYTTDPKFGAGAREVAFGETEANGQGMRTRAEIDRLVFGAKLGAAFAFELRGRQLRIKPSVGWIHYEVDANGSLTHPSCDPATICTDTYTDNTGAQLQFDGFLRESLLEGSGTGVFDGIGPGVDLEMDTGRVGPLGTALFVGVHGYYIFSDRDISFTTSRSFNDQLGSDTHTASWQVRVAPWMYRAGVGIRFQWLGRPG